MESLYLAYTNSKPLKFHIKGHDILILSTSESQLIDNSRQGSFEIKEIKIEDSLEENQFINTLAEKESADIFIVPEDLDLDSLLEGLQSELPWVH